MKLFFDVDGVLIKGYSNNPKLYHPWHTDLERDLGLRHADMQRHLFTEKFHDVATGKRGIHEAVADFLNAVSSSLPPQELIDYWFRKDSTLNVVVWDWLAANEIPQDKLYIATNQENHRASYLWNALNFKDHFSDIFYSGAIGYSKSHPEFFHAIRQKTGFAPEECVLIDDTKSVIDQAAACGWQTVLYEGAESLSDLSAKLAKSA